MPPYDCMFLFKPKVKGEALMDLIARVGKHVYRRNGVVTGFKVYGTIQLGYGIKKLDGRYFQGLMVQLSMMATPEINKELQYLNKEDWLLRWLLVKQRDTKFGIDYYADEGKNDLSKLSQMRNTDDEEEEDDDEEYEVDKVN